MSIDRRIADAFIRDNGFAIELRAQRPAASASRRVATLEEARITR